MNKEMEERLFGYIGDAYNVDPATLTRDTRIYEDLGGKSLNMAAFVSRLENELDVIISFTQAGKFKTIGEAFDKIEAQL